ncbi:relaxase/mobilization nuclease domain-containing protein [Azospirillum sp.]|uniref:relaxase/mobilization nuclease domain-containing protein n=1 Tax=Azospirillum sp. TaxID=34012 RepID=UPI002D4386BA|nr:relaxase/mobilization nuclease domain-containing protein [Azospirillum sp.]HYD70757.1 relaxase/mobilization nuclease domain-containing protein [Azospirillum sp.]
MSDGDDDVWRLPPTLRGRDVRLAPGGGPAPLSATGKARLRRIVTKAPEAMVKLTGRARGAAGHLIAQLDYLTRNGTLAAETQDGERITGRARLLELHDDWLLANAAEGRGRAGPNAAQSVALTLSMPPGTPPDRVEAAARHWARATFTGTHDWILARHDDTGHPHVHIAIRAVGADGRRLAPGPADLRQWRERFARELRRLGVEAEATPRFARGQVRKAERQPASKAEGRGIAPYATEAIRRAAEADARTDAPPPPGWSRALQARQEAIRSAYLGHAEQLERGDAADRQLARDIRRFVADMPVPLPRRQALAAALRHARHGEPGRDAPLPGPSAPEPAPGLHRASPFPAPERREPAPPRPRGRG